MTEYWVSQGNKWCDYCKIYIANNATSIRTHELGTRHKESVAKKLAAIRKDSAAKEREKEMALKDLGRIESKAMKSYEKDLDAIRKVDATVKGGCTTQKMTLEASQPSIGKTVVGKASNLASTSVKPRKGIASSLEVGKRKRVETVGPTSAEEAAALAAREAARKRTQEREKALLGLYHAY